MISKLMILFYVAVLKLEPMEFYYAKLIINPQMNAIIQSKSDLILEGLKTEKVEMFKNAIYKVVDVDEYKIDGRDYIYGAMIKYKDVEEPIYNEKEKQVQSSIVENKVLAYATFVVFLKENLVLFSEVKEHINRVSFMDRLTNILTMGLQSKFVDIDINPISEKYAFYNAIVGMHKIKEISLTIAPTNPSADDIIKDLDNQLKAQNLKSKKTVYKGKEGGIIMDTEIKSNTVYTDVGYGVGSAIGEDKDGNQIKLYSKKSDKQRKTYPIDTSRDIGYVIEDLDKLLENYEEDNT